MMIRIAEQAEQQLSQDEKNNLGKEMKKNKATRKAASWKIWRNSEKTNNEENTQSNFVEKKQENENQPTQEKKVEKKTPIVLKQSKLKISAQNTTRKYNNTINKYKQQGQKQQTITSNKLKSKKTEKNKTSSENNQSLRRQADINTINTSTQPKLVEHNKHKFVQKVAK